MERVRNGALRSLVCSEEMTLCLVAQMPVPQQAEKHVRGEVRKTGHSYARAGARRGRKAIWNSPYLFGSAHDRKFDGSVAADWGHRRRSRERVLTAGKLLRERVAER